MNADPTPYRWLTFAPLVLFAAAMLFGAAADAADDAAGDPRLRPEPWREPIYGITLNPPRGARIGPSDKKDARVVFVEPDRYQMHVIVRMASNPVELKALDRELVKQASSVAPSVVLMRREKIVAGGNVGAVHYFDVNSELMEAARDDQWVLGMAYVPLTDRLILIMQLETDVETFPGVEPLFEAAMQSVRSIDEQALRQRHDEWLRNGQAFIESFDPKAATAEKPIRQWFRIVAADGKDAGYLRTTRQWARPMTSEGLGVEVDSRTYVGATVVDSLRDAFMSATEPEEFWSRQTTARPRSEIIQDAPELAGRLTTVLRETGVRSTLNKTPVIQVTRDRPGKVDEQGNPLRDFKVQNDKLSWPVPEQAYLPQAMALILADLLPRDASKTFGFWAYDSTSGRLTFRHVEVEKQPGGATTITDRVSPDAFPHVSTFDATGRLLRRQLNDGRLLLPATPEELKRRWDLK